VQRKGKNEWLKCPKNADVETETPKEQMVTHRCGNSTQEWNVNNVTEQRNLGTPSHKIKCKLKDYMKRTEL